MRKEVSLKEIADDDYKSDLVQEMRVEMEWLYKLVKSQKDKIMYLESELKKAKPVADHCAYFHKSQLEKEKNDLNIYSAKVLEIPPS